MDYSDIFDRGFNKDIMNTLAVQGNNFLKLQKNIVNSVSFLPQSNNYKGYNIDTNIESSIEGFTSATSETSASPTSASPTFINLGGDSTGMKAQPLKTANVTNKTTKETAKATALSDQLRKHNSTSTNYLERWKEAATNKDNQAKKLKSNNYYITETYTLPELLAQKTGISTPYNPPPKVWSSANHLSGINMSEYEEPFEKIVGCALYAIDQNPPYSAFGVQDGKCYGWAKFTNVESKPMTDWSESDVNSGIAFKIKKPISGISDEQAKLKTTLDSTSENWREDLSQITGQTRNLLGETVYIGEDQWVPIKPDEVKWEDKTFFPQSSYKWRPGKEEELKSKNACLDKGKNICMERDDGENYCRIQASESFKKDKKNRGFTYTPKIIKNLYDTSERLMYGTPYYIRSHRMGTNPDPATAAGFLRNTQIPCSQQACPHNNVVGIDTAHGKDSVWVILEVYGDTGLVFNSNYTIKNEGPGRSWVNYGDSIILANVTDSIDLNKPLTKEDLNWILMSCEYSKFGACTDNKTGVYNISVADRTKRKEADHKSSWNCSSGTPPQCPEYWIIQSRYKFLTGKEKTIDPLFGQPVIFGDPIRLLNNYGGEDGGTEGTILNACSFQSSSVPNVPSSISYAVNTVYWTSPNASQAQTLWSFTPQSKLGPIKPIPTCALTQPAGGKPGGLTSGPHHLPCNTGLYAIVVKSTGDPVSIINTDAYGNTSTSLNDATHEGYNIYLRKGQTKTPIVVPFSTKGDCILLCAGVKNGVIGSSGIYKDNKFQLAESTDVKKTSGKNVGSWSCTACTGENPPPIGCSGTWTYSSQPTFAFKKSSSQDFQVISLNTCSQTVDPYCYLLTENDMKGLGGGTRLYDSDSQMYIRKPSLSSPPTGCLPDFQNSKSLYSVSTMTPGNTDYSSQCSDKTVQQLWQKAKNAATLAEAEGVKVQAHAEQLFDEEQIIDQKLVENINKLSDNPNGLLAEYETVNQKLWHVANKLPQVRAMSEDTKLQLISNNYYYFVWSILAIALVIAGIRASRS